MERERTPAGKRAAVAAATVAAGPAVAGGAGLVLGEHHTTAAALLFLLAVLVAAAVAGPAGGVLASLVSFLGLNYLFTPPRRTLEVATGDDLVALLVFVVAGTVVSTLVGALRTSRHRARQREFEARGMAAISGRLLAEDEDVVRACSDVAETIKDVLALAGCEIALDVADETVRVRAGAPPTAGAWEVQVVSGAAAIGSLRLETGARVLDEVSRRVAMVFADQLASAVERILLRRDVRRARLEAQTGRVRRALLSAVSHDFRTPLASIKAATTAVRGSAGSPANEDLLATANEEVERLERLIDNLLDLARVRSGSIAPDKVAIEVDELIDRATAGVRGTLRAHELEVEVRGEVPPVLADPVQMSHVLRNVLENAARYAPPGSAIRVVAASFRGAVEVRVIDRGPGIPPADREAVFAEFVRDEGGRGGTGLGLAIAREVVDAHGGRIWLEETPGGGATVVVSLPAAPVPTPPVEPAQAG